ncbi:MAG: DNA-binding protein [Bacteroidetes bacterium]|nr:DNA-binding protein [Bacteroidota bacterium]
MTTIHQLPLPLDPLPAVRSDTPAVVRVTNATIAHALDRAAAMLEERGANEHRVAAYRRAAETVRDHPEPLDRLARDRGQDALEALPGIGERLARRIAAFVETGELTLLRELRDAVPPERLFARLTGIGRATARRIADELGVDTLEALEVAAHDGRLAAMPGIGPGLVRSVRAQLDTLLAAHTRRDVRAALRPRRNEHPALPPLDDLLDVDAEYRYRAARAELPTIAPRRFNASGEAWLPILHTRKSRFRITAVFSNTPRAHTLGKTDDWVVLYVQDSNGGREQQLTVVTETRGELRGRRVIRGMEAACRDRYAQPLLLAA